jgi:hypothetical protein
MVWAPPAVKKYLINTCFHLPATHCALHLVKPTNQGTVQVRRNTAFNVKAANVDVLVFIFLFDWLTSSF